MSQPVMPYPILDRTQLRLKPLEARDSDMDLQELRDPQAEPPDWTTGESRLSGGPEALRDLEATLGEIVAAVRRARAEQRGVLITFGAHLIKNGLGPLLIQLMREGYVTHLATNMAGAIHDWELAFCGRTTENVRRYVREGQFGLWHETGFYLNLAAILGWAEGLGYGQALGRMIATNRFTIPTVEALEAEMARLLQGSLEEQARYRMAGQQHLRLHLQTDFPEYGLSPGEHSIPHPGGQEAFHTHYSVFGSAYALGVPITVHKGLGYDIIDTHPLADGAAMGATGYRDFLVYAASQARLEGGVYCCIGSAVMGPMIFEKAQSMVNNLRIQQGLGPMEDFLLVVNDIQPVGPDWREEPSKDHPGYYHRFTKTFRRMGGRFLYFEADNRAFLHRLYRGLQEAGPPFRKDPDSGK